MPEVAWEKDEPSGHGRKGFSNRDCRRQGEIGGAKLQPPGLRILRISRGRLHVVNRTVKAHGMHVHGVKALGL